MTIRIKDVYNSRREMTKAHPTKYESTHSLFIRTGTQFTSSVVHGFEGKIYNKNATINLEPELIYI